MGTYKFVDEKESKKPLNHEVISALLKKQLRLQVLMVAVFTFLFLLTMLFKWDQLNTARTLWLCIFAIIIVFTIYDTAVSYEKINKKKYTIELDVLKEIKLTEIVRTPGGKHTVQDILRFKNNGIYRLHNKNILDYTDIGDTFYILRCDKKYGKNKKEPIAVYSTKMYEWKE